jgi:hypothetical protein
MWQEGEKTGHRRLSPSEGWYSSKRVDLSVPEGAFGFALMYDIIVQGRRIPTALFWVGRGSRRVS